MGLEFIFVGDPHNADKPPSSRRDNYCIAILTKLAEIIEIGNRRQVDGIILAGDMFHKKIPRENSHELVQNLTTIFKLSKCPVWTIVGNHDTQGGSLEELKKQPLGTIITSGAVRLLNQEIFEFGNGMRSVVLTGHHYNRREDTFVDEIEEDTFVDEIEEDTKKSRTPGSFYIDVVHAPVVLQANFPAIYMSDLWARGRWDVLLSGHIHDEVGIHKDPNSNRLFANPGSISRGTIDEYNMLREVKVLSLKTDAGTAVMELIKLRSPRPASEVFLVEEYKRAKEQTQAFKSFATFVSDKMRVVEGIGVKEILERFFIDNGIDSDTQVAVRSYLEKARVG